VKTQNTYYINKNSIVQFVRWSYKTFMAFMQLLGTELKRHSIVGMVTRREMDIWGIITWFLAVARIYLFSRVQTGPGDQPASYSKSTRSSFPKNMVARVWSWPFIMFNAISTVCTGTTLLLWNLEEGKTCHNKTEKSW